MTRIDSMKLALRCGLIIRIFIHDVMFTFTPKFSGEIIAHYDNTSDSQPRMTLERLNRLLNTLNMKYADEPNKRISGVHGKYKVVFK